MYFFLNKKIILLHILLFKSFSNCFYLFYLFKTVLKFKKTFFQAAMAAYLKDVENDTKDLTAEHIIRQKSLKVETNKVNRKNIIKNILSR